jgi:hypothetical protein
MKSMEFITSAAILAEAAFIASKVAELASGDSNHSIIKC